MATTQCGTIFDIQRYLLHDGPGLRVLVFLKGCPLTCLWCSNPESQSFDTEMMFDIQLCLKDCTECIDHCPTKALTKSPNQKVLLFEKRRCNLCGKCIEVCPVHAPRFAGRQMHKDEVLFQIERDLPFLRRSAGGITLGGGEPTSQLKFAFDILKACREQGIHTAIETCGYTS